MCLCLEAVRCRFKLNRKMMDSEWPSLHESVLQKRRNATKRRSDAGNPND
jgi:hypothetical protein